jgi:hypothetical protein
MIPVILKPEPTNFDSDIRRPGRAFLVRNPAPTSKQYQANAFWKKSAKDLYAAYSGICAYSCFYMPSPPGTTDHFLPKSSHPNEAYEWSNYRLSQYKLNQYKGDNTDVIDPFVVQPGWFILDFPSCLVRPGKNLPVAVHSQIESTITRLKLNDDDSLVQERCNIMVDFSQGNVALSFLERRYPFLAIEIQRQGLEDNAAMYFKKTNSENSEGQRRI